MRTLARILIAVGLALAVSTTANATISVTLRQTGGDYVPSSGGTTLTLTIYVSEIAPIGSPIGLGGVFVDITYDDSVVPFSGTATESPFTFIAPGTLLTPIGTYFGDTGSVMTGWDTTTVTRNTVTGYSFSLGTVTFALSGQFGIISVGGPNMAIGDGDFNIVTGTSYLGTFCIATFCVPEPTTASLLGLGLIGIAAGRRRGRS